MEKNIENDLNDLETGTIGWFNQFMAGPVRSGRDCGEHVDAKNGKTGVPLRASWGVPLRASLTKSSGSKVNRLCFRGRAQSAVRI